MEAISLLSHLLKIESSCFRYAGTKDKRAVTSQLVTAFKVTAERLNQNLGNMRLGNFQLENDAENSVFPQLSTYGWVVAHD